MAKEKGILIKVFGSCLANEIPAELAFSTHGIMNMSFGMTTFNVPNFQGNEIHEGQHPCGLDFTQVRCRNKIEEICTMAPCYNGRKHESTWVMWNIQHRLMIITGTEGSRGQQLWLYLLPVDDEETIRILRDKTTGVNAGKLTIDASDYGQVILSGWGQKPPDEAQKLIEKHYYLNYDSQ